MKEKVIGGSFALKAAWALLILAAAVVILLSMRSAGSVSIPSDSIFI